MPKFCRSISTRSIIIAKAFFTFKWSISINTNQFFLLLLSHSGKEEKPQSRAKLTYFLPLRGCLLFFNALSFTLPK